MVSSPASPSQQLVQHRGLSTLQGGFTLYSGYKTLGRPANAIVVSAPESRHLSF